MAEKASSPKKDKGTQVLAVNRKASHDYEFQETLEAGIELLGSEVKSCRMGRIQMVDSYASIERGELYLYKAHIGEFEQGGPFFNHVPLRKRRLLVHKREILKLQANIEKAGYTLIPLQFYTARGRIKVKLALAKGKTKGDKRRTEAEKTSTREVAKALRRGTRSSRDFDDE